MKTGGLETDKSTNKEKSRCQVRKSMKTEWNVMTLTMFSMFPGPDAHEVD